MNDLRNGTTTFIDTAHEMAPARWDLQPLPKFVKDSIFGL